MKARRFVLPLILVIVAFSAYANSFSGVFLFDDIIRIVEEERVHRLWPMWPLLSGERPVVDVTLAANYALGGLNPWGFHAANLLIHILAGLTLFGMVRRTIDRQQGNEATRQQGKDQRAKKDDGQYIESIANCKSTIDNSASLIAFAVALIFLVHPLQTQSVTYVIQRGESLMGLFYLLTLYCAVRAMDSPRHWLWCVASVVFCALGMGTKAVMVTAPLMVMIYDWVFLRCEARRVGCAHHRRWPLYAGLCSTWIILWLCGIGPEVLGQSSTTSHVGFSYHGVTPGQYAATQPGVIVKYLQLAFWPAHLCLDYDWPVATQWPQIVLPAITIAVLLSITGWLLWRRHWLGFVGAWFFVILAPTSSIVPIKDLLFEHRMYLPLAAVIAALVVPIGLWIPKQIGNWKLAIGNTIDNRQSTIANSTMIPVTIIIALAAPLAYATHLRNRDYQSELTMWQDVAAKRPNNARAHVGIGVEKIKSKQWSNAIASLRRAISLKDPYADAHYNLAIALAATHNDADAANEYLRTAQLNPARTDALINAAQLLGRIGEHGRAIQVVRQAITVKPSDGELHYHLGNALADYGDVDGAKREFEQAVLLKPELALARINLGNVYLQQRLLQEARTQYEQALTYDPGNSTAVVNLGRVWLQQEQWEQALETFRQVSQNDPLASEAKFGAGWALARLNRHEEARAELHNALRIDPTHAGAAAELARLEAERRSPD